MRRASKGSIFPEVPPFGGGFPFRALGRFRFRVSLAFDRQPLLAPLRPADYNSNCRNFIRGGLFKVTFKSASIGRNREVALKQSAGQVSGSSAPSPPS
jgi:hypothetical protein